MGKWSNPIKNQQTICPLSYPIKNNYTQHLLIDTVKLRSKYSILLYKLMRECDKDKGKTIAILQGKPDEFKEWLGAPENYDYKRLKENILKKQLKKSTSKLKIWT